MKKEQLRNGLKRLDSYIKKLDFHSTFLEEGAAIPMDSLIVPLRIADELSIDISCNFIDVPNTGTMLQFYGHLPVNGMLNEAAAPVPDYDILSMINELNRMLPVGQLLYLRDGAEDTAEKALGIRYTMLTELDSEEEMKKCVYVFMLLMQVYELLCSSLILLLDGESVDEVLEKIMQLIEN